MKALALLAGVTVGALVVAWASSLAVSSGKLGAGNAAVSACDSDGFTFTYTIDSSGHIVTTTVGGIAVGCAGGRLRVTLTASGANVGEGSVTLPSSGFSGSAAVSISPAPQSSLVTATYAGVEGP
jgi:hypothetical protein